MAEDDDDFAFPTTVPGSAAPGDASSSRLWPFAAPLIGETTTATAAAGVKEGEVEAPAVVDDEDRMDMLWDDTAAEGKTKIVVVRAEPEPHHAAAAAAKPAQEDALDDERAAAVAEQERMDLLWESFNEELLLLRQRRARSKSTAGDGKQHGPEPDWYLCPSSASDADESEVSSPGRARHGCAPAMLRASSRAGGAGQFYGSPRRRGRSGGGWALLLRLFRRLFSAGDKAPPRRQSFYVP